MFERALAVFPVTTELWYQYTRYLETELKISQVGGTSGQAAWCEACLCCIGAMPVRQAVALAAHAALTAA
jgi:hypothetical protein